MSKIRTSGTRGSAPTEAAPTEAAPTGPRICGRDIVPGLLIGTTTSSALLAYVIVVIRTIAR